MPENNNVTTTNAAEKQYIVKIGSAPKPQVWSFDKYERNKDALFMDHADAEVYEVTPDNGEQVNAGDVFNVHIPGTEQGQIWDADKYGRNREALAADHPGAEVKRVRPVDYWGDQLTGLESQIAELQGTTQEAQNQWNVLRYNEFEKGSDEEVAAGRKVKGFEKELDALYRKREDNPVYKKRKNAIGTYLETMLGNVKQEAADLQKEYAPELKKSDNLNIGVLNRDVLHYHIPEYDRDSAALTAARMYYDDAIKMWNAPSKYGNESGFSNFFKGLIGEAPEALSVVQLAKAVGEGAPIIDIVNRIHEHEGDEVNIMNLIQNEPDKLDYLSDAQKTLLQAFVTKSSVDAARANDLSLGYQAGQSAMQSLGFMADFLLTGGVGEAAAKGATQGLMKGAAKGLTKIGNEALHTVAREGAKFGIGTLQSGVKTLAISGMMPSTYANVINNLAAINDAGDLDLSGKAIANAVGDALIENFSESAGTQVEAILGMPFKALGATGAGKLFANTKFGEWAKALKDAPAGRIMKQAGWNGFIGEIGEEWYGNALRVATGVDPDALKNFATVDQQIITLASFAPMSILGGGASVAQYEVSKKRVESAGKYLRQALTNAGYDEATIDNVLSVANAENPTELANGLAPVIVQTANDNAFQLNAVFKAVMDYAGAVSTYRTYGGFIDADVSEKRQAMSDEISAGMGVQAAQEGEAEPMRPWVITRMHQVPDGSYVSTNSVRVVTDKDGIEYFVQSEGEDGSLAAIDRQGKPHIISRADLTDGTMTDTGEMSLNDFLDRELVKRRVSEDERRVQSQFEQNRQNLLSQAVPGATINLGTVENPKRGTIIAWQAGKFIVQDENGAVEEVAEEQMSHILNVPYNVETEDEAIGREVSDIERKEELRMKANAVRGVDVSSVLGLEGNGVLHSVSIDDDGNFVANIRIDEDNIISRPVSEDELALVIALGEQNSPTEVKEETEVEVASENGNEVEEQPADDTPRDFRGNPLPMRTNKKGEQVVDETALWNNDPEAWCHYNDVNPEQIVTSVEKLEYAEKELAKQATAAEKAMKKAALKGTTQDEMDDLREAYKAQKDRLAVVQGIRAEYEKPAEEESNVPDNGKVVVESSDENTTVVSQSAPSESSSEESVSNNETQTMLHGDSLPEGEASELVSEMESHAEVAPEVELTPENWDAIFGDGRVSTPIGIVKMGENQFLKLMRQGRNGKLGMVKPTLETPFVVIEVKSDARDGETAERKSSYVFLKAFVKADGSRYYYFTSITISKDGLEVVISNQEKSRNRVMRLISEGKVIWRTPKDATDSSTESQGLDYAQPEQVETATKGSEITPQNTPSADKDTNSSEETNEESTDSSSEVIADNHAEEKVGIQTETPAAQAEQPTPLTDAQKQVASELLGVSEEEMEARNEELQEQKRQEPLKARAKEWDARTGVKVNAISSIDEVTNKQARKAIESGETVFGWFEPKTGTVCLYLPHVPDESEIDKTYIHEVISHKGLRELLGEEGFNSLMDSVWNDMMSDEDKASFLASVSHVKGSELDKQRAAADEFVASYAENLDLNKPNSKWDKFVEAIREILAKLGISLKVNEKDLSALLQASLARYEKMQAEKREDGQGNPLNEDGTLKLERVNSIDELTDEDFTNPTRSVELPMLPKNVDAAIGANGKPVIIKKNIFEKNKRSHSDLSPEQSRDILNSALYNPDLYGQSQKNSRPYNWVVINTVDENGKNRIVLLELNPTKDNIEVVHWHYIGDGGLGRIKKQAAREGEHILVLPSSVEEEAGALPGRPSDLSSEDKDSEKSTESNTSTSAEKQEDGQGNPLNEDGTLKLERVNSIDELTDEDFTNPTRSVELPMLPKNVDAAIGANGKPVIIKKNIFEKNSERHDYTPAENRGILAAALYSPNLVGQTKPSTKASYWVAIKVDDNSSVTILEVSDKKDNIEVVGWYTLDKRNLERMKRQAEREGGELLILTPEKSAAASLSTLPSDLSSEGKDSEKSTESNTSTSAEKQEDGQGNPLNEDGTLKLERVNSIDELTDEDFTNPTRSVELPMLPKNVDAAIGANGKPVIIKKNIFEKNKRSHSDLLPEQSRDILNSALYNPDLYGQNQKTNRPYNWVVINTVDRNGKNRLVLLEVADNKDNVEIINWHFVRDNALNTLKRQAEREGGLILILPSESTEEAGGLSSRPSDLSSEDKDSEKSTESNTSTSEEDSQPTEAQKDVLGRVFGMSPEEVEKEHKARKSRKKDNEQVKKIEDFGEKIAGARKDALRNLSKSLEDATEESFVALALSKAFKRPNTKKLVEDGVLSPEDATFVDAVSWFILGSPKPTKLKGGGYKAERRDQEILEWAKEQAQRANIIHEYINVDEAGKKAIIDNLSKIPDDVKSSVDALRNRWAELNKGWNDVKIGELYPLNPVYVAYRVFQSSGYDPDMHGRVKFPVIKCDTGGNSYTIEIEKNGSRFIARSVEDALSRASYLVQLQLGAEDLDHPASVFKVYGIRDTKVLSGAYRVFYNDRRGLAMKEFNSKDAAVKFAMAKYPGKTEEELLSDSSIKEIEKWADPTKFKIVCTDAVTGETYELDKVYGSKEDAVSAIDSNYEELNSQFNSALQKAREAKGESVNKGDKLYVAWYYEDGRGSYGVFAKDKSFKEGYVLFSGGFETSEAARTYMEEHRAKYEELLKDMAEQRRSFVFFDGNASPRKGKDYRHGKDVGEEDYNVFGFRGVQFGNWANNADRQAALNNAYDAFMDLADALGVSPAALSLNGELGLAFGARGGGNASAHYEASEVVINLTKTRGAGSLAHEWWHALDNYFARHGGIANGFLTESYIPDVRPAVRMVFEELTDAVRKSNYGKRSSKMGVYWGSAVETTARLFAEWADRKMASNGESNHFLVRGVSDEKAREYEELNYAIYKMLAKSRIARDPNTKEKILTFEEFRKTPDALVGFPYPTTEEIKTTFGPLMQEVFDTIEEKSEDGKQVLFRKAGNGRRWYGGNSGYVGYSMSNRAAEAREEGKFPKTDFMNEYGVSKRDLDELVNAGVINNSEWHHTSKYGNKTTFYGWEIDDYARIYTENKNEIKELIGELVKKRKSITPSTEVNPYTYSNAQTTLTDRLRAIDDSYYRAIRKIPEVASDDALDYYRERGWNVISKLEFDKRMAELASEYEQNRKTAIAEASPEDRAIYEENERYHEFNQKKETPIEYEMRVKAEMRPLRDFFDSRVKDEDDDDATLYRRGSSSSIEEVNERFNEDIDRYANGEMQSREYFTVGLPSGPLSIFVVNKPIILRQSILTKAAKKHGVDASHVKNLPVALSEPIFIFKSSQKTISVLTELKTSGGKNIFVAMELDAQKQLGHEFLEVNDILTVHGREEENVINPIVENNSLKWVDKEKGQRWLSSAKSNSQAIDNEDLISATKIVEDFENPTLPEDDDVIFRKESMRRAEMNRVNNTIDNVIAFVQNTSKSEARAYRQDWLNEHKRNFAEICERTLSGNFDSVTLGLIDKYINDATPKNPYGRRISQRVPQTMERGLYEGARANAVDALFTRVCESTIRETGSSVARDGARRAIEEKKKELLKGWAVATGNWHTSISDFTDESEPLGKGKDSDVYLGKDGDSVIKVSKGKNDGKRFRPDIDAVTLFNGVFPNSAYEVVGYGEINGKFVKFLRQPFVDFSDVAPLSESERVDYMSKLGFVPYNKDRTAFSNGDIIVSDLQKANIVKDKAGNVSVIDADVKLHTKDFGGSYTYPDVSEDFPNENAKIAEMELVEGTQASAVGLDGNPVPSSINSISGAKLLKGVKKTNSDELILPEDEDNTRFRRRGMTVPVQGEDESDIDFARRCIDRISYTYNTMADGVSVTGEDSDRGGEYDPNTGRVTIFASQGDDFFVYEDAYFHENLHAFIDKEYDGAEEEIKEFYENARLNHPHGFDRCVQALRDLGYIEEVLPEELFVYTVSNRFVNGKLASDWHLFDLGEQNIIEEYAKRIGYDIKEEEQLRSVFGFSDRLRMRDTVREETTERRSGEESEGGSRSEAVGARGYTGDGVDWRSSSMYQREVLRETARVIGAPMELVQGTYESPAAGMVDASGRPIVSRWNKGRVQICPSLCRDANDAVCTYLHEAVGHSGLSSVFDQNQRRKLYLGIYNALPDAVRREVASKAVTQYGGSVVSAMEAFLSDDAIQEAKGNPISVIEDSANPEEYRKSVWNVVRDGLTSAFGNKGLEVSLSSNDAKWLMAQSAFPNHESNPLEEATRQVVANHLGFTRTQQAYKADGIDALRFRRKVNFQSDSAAEIYDRAVSNAWGRLKESYVDMYQSVEEGVKAIEQTTGKPARAFENVLLALNQQSSKALATMQRWQSTKFTPMMKAIVNLANAISGKVEDVERYVMLKHGLERNDVFAKRDALDFYQRAHDEAVKTIEKSNLGDEEKAARIADEDDKLDMHRQEIDNGTDAKYLKLREKDYSGLTGMYMEQGGDIQRNPSETDLEFTIRLMKARHPMFVDKNGNIDLAAIEDEARREVEAMENAHTDLTDVLWNTINAATRATLKEQYEANLLSRDQYMRIRDMFEYYVPLRGFDDETSDDFYSYYAGSSHSGYVNPIMHAEGRKSKAESPFGYIAAAESSAVAQGSKNMTKLALYYFVTNRANNDLLSVSDVWYKQVGLDQDDKPIYEAAYPNIPENATRAEVEQAVSDFEDDMKRMEKAGLAFKGKNKLSLYGGTLRPSSSKMEHEHVIPFKLAGKDMMLIVHGNPRMAQAFTGALNYNAENGAFTKFCQEALRFMASLNTQMNPEFWISNFQRDLLFSMMAVNVKEDKAYQRQFMENLKSSIKNVIKYKKAYDNGTLGNSYEENLYRQFVDNGGVTGYTVMHDNAYWERRLKEFAGEERNIVTNIVEDIMA